jgi:DDE superfamily endonuclease
MTLCGPLLKATSTVFDTSDILRRPLDFFSELEYLLADSGYALSPYIMVPHRQPAAELPHNKIFNQLLSSTRVVIEHVNGVLKNRWASLKGIRTQIRNRKDFEKVNNHVLVCLILHNILIDINDAWEEPEIVEEVVPVEEMPQGQIPASGEVLRHRMQEHVLGVFFQNH